MPGGDYKEGHPAFHPFCHYDTYVDHLVCITSDGRREQHNIVNRTQANNNLIVEATDEEKRRLRAAGYQMIGLEP